MNWKQISVLLIWCSLLFGDLQLQENMPSLENRISFHLESGESKNGKFHMTHNMTFIEDASRPLRLTGSFKISRWYGTHEEIATQISEGLLPLKIVMRFAARNFNVKYNGKLVWEKTSKYDVGAHSLKCEISQQDYGHRFYFNGKYAGTILHVGEDEKYLYLEIPTLWVNFPTEPGVPAENTLELLFNSRGLPCLTGYKTYKNEKSIDYSIDPPRMSLSTFTFSIPAVYPILLQSGYQGNPENFKAMRNVIRKCWGIPVIPLTPYPNTGIYHNAMMMEDEIQALQEKYHVKYFNLIAHSKGGLDARVLTNQGFGERPCYIKYLIQIATPNGGAPNCDQYFADASSTLVKYATRWKDNHIIRDSEALFDLQVRVVHYSLNHHFFPHGWYPANIFQEGEMHGIRASYNPPFAPLETRRCPIHQFVILADDLSPFLMAMAGKVAYDHDHATGHWGDGIVPAWSGNCLDDLYVDCMDAHGAPLYEWQHFYDDFLGVDVDPVTMRVNMQQLLLRAKENPHITITNLRVLKGSHTQVIAENEQACMRIITMCQSWLLERDGTDELAVYAVPGVTTPPTPALIEDPIEYHKKIHSAVCPADGIPRKKSILHQIPLLASENTRYSALQDMTERSAAVSPITSENHIMVLEDSIPSVSEALTGNSVHTHTFYTERPQKTLKMSAMALPPGTKVEIVAPDKRKYEYMTGEASEDFQYAEGTDYSPSLLEWTRNNAPPGDYQITVTGDPTAAPETPLAIYSIRWIESSPVFVQATIGMAEQQICVDGKKKGHFLFHATLATEEGLLKGDQAQMQLQISCNGDTSSLNYVLKDDGIAPDEVANDGIYTWESSGHLFSRDVTFVLSTNCNFRGHPYQRDITFFLPPYILTAPQTTYVLDEKLISIPMTDIRYSEQYYNDLEISFKKFNSIITAVSGISAKLYCKHGELIASYVSQTNPNRCVFPGVKIVEHNCDGPYIVKDVHLLGLSGRGCIDAGMMEKEYITAPYKISDFMYRTIELLGIDSCEILYPDSPEDTPRLQVTLRIRVCSPSYYTLYESMDWRAWLYWKGNSQPICNGGFNVDPTDKQEVEKVSDIEFLMPMLFDGSAIAASGGAGVLQLKEISFQNRYSFSPYVWEIILPNVLDFSAFSSSQFYPAAEHEKISNSVPLSQIVISAEAAVQPEEYGPWYLPLALANDPEAKNSGRPVLKLMKAGNNSPAQAPAAPRAAIPSAASGKYYPPFSIFLSPALLEQLEELPGVEVGDRLCKDITQMVLKALAVTGNGDSCWDPGEKLIIALPLKGNPGKSLEIPVDEMILYGSPNPPAEIIVSPEESTSSEETEEPEEETESSSGNPVDPLSDPFHPSYCHFSDENRNWRIEDWELLQWLNVWNRELGEMLDLLEVVDLWMGTGYEYDPESGFYFSVGREN